MSYHKKETKADTKIKECLDERQSFAVVAGAGSGKTTSLVDGLKYLRETKGSKLRQEGRNIVCITYTNRAVEVISQRLEWDDLFRVSTIHNFLWDSVNRFTHDIRTALQTAILPEEIEKKAKDDNGKETKKAKAARQKVIKLKEEIEALNEVEEFQYNDSNFSNYSEGLIGHDDIIKISAYLIQNNPILRSILSQKYPYIFVDEAQDTFPVVVDALNSLSGVEASVIGYFGDPMQQIYDKRAGDFVESGDLVRIDKEENFRCSPEVITLLNACRSDVQQFPAGNNADVQGSVRLFLIKAEEPEAPRKRYSEAQAIKAAQKYDQVVESIGWAKRDDVKHLFLVRQMIARRLGFSTLHNLFTGQYSSTKSQENYEAGDHFLLKPFVNCLCDLIAAYRNEQSSEVLRLLRQYSPAFAPHGINSNQTISKVQELATKLTEDLNDIWDNEPIGTILKFCKQNGLYSFSDRLVEDLKRDHRTEEFDSEIHSDEKGEWLADIFYKMGVQELPSYADFVRDQTAYSTQHGVKGEEYRKVVTVFDDTEAAWSLYSFAKTLTPETSGKATDGQYDKSTKLAYVCFSRAEVDLCVIFFTQQPEEAKREFIGKKLFSDEQIAIVY